MPVFSSRFCATHVCSLCTLRLQPLRQHIFPSRACISRLSGVHCSKRERETSSSSTSLYLSISLFLFFNEFRGIRLGKSVGGGNFFENCLPFSFLRFFFSSFFSFFGNILLRIIVDVRKKRKEWKLILSRDPGKGRGGLIGYYFENVTSRLYVYIFFIFHDFSQILQLDL